MTSHSIKISVNDYRLILSGIKNFLVFERSDEFHVCDKLRFKEFNGSIYTGRVIECFITDIDCGEYVTEGHCIISFQLVFPEVEPRFPMRCYMELFELYSQLREQCEDIKELV